ncbi:MAG: GNAT family N-acetyltransferase [Actinomycetota bacterium]|nr:GNAT family N-acetyltransferase [Actinomycetota bacterium]
MGDEDRSRGSTLSELHRPDVEVLTTKRLRLEPNDLRHSEEMWISAQESMSELRPWLRWTVDASLEEIRTWARICKKKWADNQGWVFAILFEGRPIGVIGIDDVDHQTLRGELGYWMHSAYSGRGLMTEAGATVVSFGFDVVGLHRMQLDAGVDNVGSVRVAEKIGFKREGIGRDSCRGADGFYDAFRFGLLSTDPRPFANA